MMKKLTLNETMVDLRDWMRFDSKFIEEFNSINKEEFEFECIIAYFEYNPCLKGVTENEEDWYSFKNYIAADFNKLAYPPCHIYVNRDEVTAIWFVPNDFLINGLGINDINIIRGNMEKQLKTLETCCLFELHESSGDREIVEKFYFEEYYRKNMFDKVLLAKKSVNDKSA